MWDEQQRARFESLRFRQQPLSEAELAELARLTNELEAAEAEYLRPATERLRSEREVVEAQNRALEALSRRKSDLVARLRDVLQTAREERRAIDGELAAVLAGGHGAGPDN